MPPEDELPDTGTAVWEELLPETGVSSEPNSPVIWEPSSSRMTRIGSSAPQPIAPLPEARFGAGRGAIGTRFGPDVERVPEEWGAEKGLPPGCEER